MILIITVKVYRVILRARSRRSKLQDNEDLIEFAGQKFPVEIVEKLKAVGINTPNQFKNATKKQLISSGIDKNLIENIWWKRQKDKSGNRKIKEKIEAEQKRKAAEAAKQAEQKRKEEEEEEAARQVEENYSTNNRGLSSDRGRGISNGAGDSVVDNDTPAEERLKIIGYQLTDEFVQDDPYKYPVAMMPIPMHGVYNVMEPLSGRVRQGKLGITEPDFHLCLKKYFTHEYVIFNDKHVIAYKNQKRPHEPDFVICNTQKDKNIFINVEIDEPYDLETGVPTHYLNSDDYRRDEAFRNIGWIVIRFAEIQIKQNAESCCLFIANVLNELDPDFAIPFDLQQYDSLQPIDQWNSLKSKKWAEDRYRQEYLGIENDNFVPPPQDNNLQPGYTLTNAQNFFLNELAKKQEPFQSFHDEIKDTHLGSKNEFDEKYKERNTRIAFRSEGHRYVIDNNYGVTSVSQLIDEFFPEFDADIAIAKMRNGNKWAPGHKYWELDDDEIKRKWKEKGEKAARDGTELHKLIEMYYQKQSCDSSEKEFEHFLSFTEDHPTLEPIMTEWRIFDEEHRIAGTVDMIYKNENGTYTMYDWKRSKKVIDETDGQPITNNRWGEKGFGELNDIDKTVFNKYCLQLNLYRHILETRYKLEISSMNILVLHPKHDKYYAIEVPNMQGKVDYILNSHKN